MLEKKWYRKQKKEGIRKQVKKKELRDDEKKRNYRERTRSWKATTIIYIYMFA